MSIDLLAFLSKKERYDQYRQFISEDILEKELSQIVGDMKDYYTAFPSDIDWAKFSTWFFAVKHPTFKSDNVKIYRKIFSLTEKTKTDPSLVEAMVKSFVTRSFATQIYKEVGAVAEGVKGSLDGVVDLMAKFDAVVDKARGIEDATPSWEISKIMSETVGSTGLNWRLPILNQSLGPLRKGNFIIMGARPDTGKTSFLAAEASFMAQQLKDDEKVLWFNNEEAGRKVQLRILQAALNVTAEDIEVDEEAAMKRYTKMMHGDSSRIIVYDKAVIDVKDINVACKKHNVKLIIFDQLWKVQGVAEATNDVHRMTLLFNLGREWAKLHAPVITVHQCDGSAGGMEYIPMENLYMSKTGVQGEADAIIMMGRSYDPAKAGSRFINLPKNKLAGGPDSVPSMRNMQREVELDHERCQFTVGTGMF